MTNATQRALLDEDEAPMAVVQHPAFKSQDPARGRPRGLKAILNTVPAAVFIAHESEARRATFSRATCEMLRAPPGGNESTPAPSPMERPTRLKFIPSVLDPTPRQLARLNATDRELLGRVLREPVEYIDSPALHHPDADSALFSTWTSPAGKMTRFAGMASTHSHSDQIPSSAQERLLFEQFNYARMRREQLLRQFDHKRMPIDELRLLLTLARRELDVRNRIVELNMPLVLAMVRRFGRRELDHNDLVSEGNLALLRCVDKFDCSRGFKFSTYACRAILKSFSSVSLRAGRYTSRFPVSYDPAMEPSDFADGKHADAKSMCMEEVRKILTQNRAELSVREQSVINARFMLGNNRPDSPRPSLAQVGDQIGLTKERVRQIQNCALGKLRDVLEGSFLTSAKHGSSSHRISR